MTTVRVRIIGPDGTLTEPVTMPKVVLSDAEWRKRLTPEQFRIARNQGTERAFCGGLLKNKESGVYACVCCNLPLFASAAKFESGTGWPSFFQPVAVENVVNRPDNSHGMLRTEILCGRCDGHLGHVFPDGPAPTGLRFCLNSESLRFVADTDLSSIAEELPQAAKPKADSGERAEAVFAGGCFWCVEAVFEQLDGVVDAVSGYAGGTAETANYTAVCTGNTDHAEAVKIVYDPQRISYEQLLRVHFATHDPTTLNRQGPDSGRQYRSSIFFADEVQKKAAEAVVADLQKSRTFGSKKIWTTLEPLNDFYNAEPYHQDFVTCNPLQPYVRAIAVPKVDKARKSFPEMLKSKP